MAGNTILRHPTLTILQQIEELKTWHKHQQLKMNSENLQTDKIENTGSEVELAKEENIKRVQSKLKHYLVGHNFDEVPIKVANPNLNDVIENNIDPNDAQHYETNYNEVKPKFQFLRKGEGLARFRMGPQKIYKYRNNNNHTFKLCNGMKTSDDVLILNGKHPEVEEKQKVETSVNIPTLTPPDLRLDTKNWKTSFESEKVEENREKAIDNNQIELFQPNSFTDSSAASILAFEIMEQHVLNSSFCSTSSCVKNFMKNAIISTPVKTSLMNCNSIATSIHSNLLSSFPSPERQEILVPINENKALQEPIWTNPGNNNYFDMKSQGDIPNTNDFDQSLQVRYAEQINYKSFVEYFPCINNNSNQKEANTCKEFNGCEEWEEESEDSECCSHCNYTYSSSDEGVRPLSPLPKSSLVSQKCQISNRESQSNTQNRRNSPVAKIDEVKINSSGIPSSGHSYHAKVDKDNFPPVISEKMKELEQEIEMFSIGNSKLKALHEGLEKEHKQFEKEKKKMLKEIEEKKQTELVQLEEERKKLSKNKLVFEKYLKSLTKNPTKEEKKEIQALREQLREMKQELNKKECRWGSAQARVRNQVKLLEENNKKLKVEIESIQKQCRHLEFLTENRKIKPFNNTKFIHASNKHISNNAVEHDANLKKVSTGAGYCDNINKTKPVFISKIDPNSKDIVQIIKKNKPKSSIVAHDETNPKLSELSHNRNAPNHNLARLNHTSAAEPLIQEIDKLQQEKCLQSLNSDNSQGDTNQEQLHHSGRETNEESSVEIVYPSGKKEISYKNGNIKKIDSITGNEKLIYFNGDVKEVTRDGTVRYYFSADHTWQTTLPDGLEIFDFPNQQVEKRHKNGMVEVLYPSGCKKIIHPGGSEEIYYTNGNMLKIEANKKRKVLYLPNGQKEIQTDECIRREYPDGTIRIVYPDGAMETTYSNGRVRLKDKHGNLVMDSSL